VPPDSGRISTVVASGRRVGFSDNGSPLRSIVRYCRLSLLAVVEKRTILDFGPAGGCSFGRDLGRRCNGLNGSNQWRAATDGSPGRSGGLVTLGV
jgi:hypothetical protein